MGILVRWILCVFLLAEVLTEAVIGEELATPCDSDVYCYGDILHTVQFAHLHKDSKTFVDMPMRFDREYVWKHFNLMMNITNGKPSKNDVAKFVEENFDEAGSEFEKFHPTDWNPSPAFLLRIHDRRLRDWMFQLHNTWKELGRQVRGEVFLHPERFSSIYVPNPTIVPGGRFREFYYWDSYWVVKGLLLSEMRTTVRGMLENFLAMVKRYGMVPNGGRVYFSRRSQPPFLIPMTQLYIEDTNDLDFLRMNMALLEKEYNFWRKNRTVQVVKNNRRYTMYRYSAQIGKPRPESYREDMELASSCRTDNEKGVLYDELASACETGWDFSSRWIPNVTGTLKDLKTRSMIPVDLNSLMVKNSRILSRFSSLLGLGDKARLYELHAEQTIEAIREVLWDETLGSWFDWDLDGQKLHREFYLSSIFPIWVGASTPAENVQFLDYFTQINATSYISGVPTSFLKTGQQWDFPNSWPPLQHIMIEALERIGSERSKQLAFEQASSWMSSVFLTYLHSKPHAMFEKYNVTRVGVPGGGGEYDVQLGFGWTNGVVLSLGAQYGQLLVAPSISSTAVSETNSAASGEPPIWLTVVVVSLSVSVVLAVSVG